MWKPLVPALLACSLLTACGPATEAELAGEELSGMDETAEALSASSRSYVRANKDKRRCAAPQCGGYYVKDVNRPTSAEQYVWALDFKNAPQLTATEQAEVLAAGDGELVLWGKLGPSSASSGLRTFLVYDAWRGMPGVSSLSADTFFAVDSKAALVRCAAAPCMSETAKRLNSTSTQVFSSYDLLSALPAFGDGAWLQSEVMNRGALVAATVRNGASMTAGPDVVLDASQVFLKVAGSKRTCPATPSPSCGSGRVYAWDRDMGRCRVPLGCVTSRSNCGGAPTCAPGYTRSAWTTAQGCTAYACDPTFSL
jgi:hypothetical protein